ncbi:nucleoside deaminase [Arthrobacter sp. I2-34]|uniref:Nucleoside deaminase n=1 Tax=Arthrobacter hankyongi TaxID=2904801 RepID=A0ABS9L8N4_9MICC|nr:nucleoside deaminase [Arthrobacter hankyongi]MCG2623040.1 nucleoside deaminase [Arthrobacter hankyongi]
MSDTVFLELAVDLAWQARRAGNRPFGSAVVDPAGTLVATGLNTAVTSGDVTGHSETNAVRAALAQAGTPATGIPLAGHTLYSSTEPCIMCTGALYLAGISRVVYALRSAELDRLSGPNPGVRMLPFSLDAALQAGDGLTVSEYVPLAAAREVHLDCRKDPS